jgi:alpha-galactosidase
MHVSKTGHLLNLYYGRKIEIVNDDISFLDEKVVYPHGTTPFYNDEIAKGFTLDGVNQEYPTAGKGDYRESSLVIETKLGYVTDFKYDSARVEEEVLLQELPSCVNQKENLIVTLKDEVLNLKLELIYGIYEDKDVITRSVRLINEDKETVYINKIASFNLDLSSDEFELINFNGAWILETHQSNKKLLPGIYVNDSKTGNSSPVKRDTEMRTLRWCNDADLWQKERSALSLLPLLQRLKKSRWTMSSATTPSRRNRGSCQITIKGDYDTAIRFNCPGGYCRNFLHRYSANF